jgi:hypothetical protein
MLEVPWDFVRVQYVHFVPGSPIVYGSLAARKLSSAKWKQTQLAASPIWRRCGSSEHWLQVFDACEGGFQLESADNYIPSLITS